MHLLVVFPTVKVADHTTEMHDPYYKITLSEGHVTSTSYSIHRPVCATLSVSLCTIKDIILSGLCSRKVLGVRGSTKCWDK